MNATDLLGRLRQILQDGMKPATFEELAAASFWRLLGVIVAVARSGSQHGGDAGPSERQDRRFRLEAKRYADSSALGERELLGEMDHALARGPALEAWILVATREASEQLEQSLTLHGERLGVPVVILDWKARGFPALAALCGSIDVENWLWRRLSADRQPVSPRLNHASLQKVDLAAAVHLAANELQLGDMSLRLAVGPEFDDGGSHGILVVHDPRSERGQLATLRVPEPGREIVRLLRRYHGLEAIVEVACRDDLG